MSCMLHKKSLPTDMYYIFHATQASKTTLHKEINGTNVYILQKHSSVFAFLSPKQLQLFAFAWQQTTKASLELYTLTTYNPEICIIKTMEIKGFFNLKFTDNLTAQWTIIQIYVLTTEQNKD